MSAAATAVAAALASAIAQSEALAAREYDNALKSVGSLQDVGYHKFVTQVLRVAFANNWHDSVLDNTVAVLVGEHKTAKYDKDVRYA